MKWDVYLKIEGKNIGNVIVLGKYEVESWNVGYCYVMRSL